MCALKTLLCGVLLICLMRLDQSSGGLLDIFFHNMNSTYDKEIMQHFESRLIERNGRNVLRAEFEFFKQINRFDATLGIDLPGKKKGIGQFLTVSADGCEALEPTYAKQRIVQIVVHGLRYGNSTLPEHCPFEANRRYTIDQFYLHSEMFPSVLPEMLVNINFTILVQKRAAFSVFGRMDFLRE